MPILELSRQQKAHEPHGQRVIESAIKTLLGALVPEWESDPNFSETPARVARMYANELCAGLTTPAPLLKSFPKPEGMDQLIGVGPITVNSLCPHHLAPIVGHAFVGIIPGKQLLGLSKYARLVRWCMARPIIQESATQMVAHTLREALPDAVAIGVVVRARHMCMTWRGVQEPAAFTTTSALDGLFRTDAASRSEFLKFVEGER